MQVKVVQARGAGYRPIAQYLDGVPKFVTD
jgi:hypothetical protein